MEGREKEKDRKGREKETERKRKRKAEKEEEPGKETEKERLHCNLFCDLPIPFLGVNVFYTRNWSSQITSFKIKHC